MVSAFSCPVWFTDYPPFHLLGKDSVIPQTISHYRVLNKLGEGGMGEVYLAEDTVLERQVAIKFLPPDSLTSPRARSRLMREARAAAALDHGNICTIHEVVEADEQNFIVMQYVEGETLDSFLASNQPEWRYVLEISTQIAGALADAHSHGVIHRDIKPQNIMIAENGRVKVLDFGLAKVVSPLTTIERDALTKSLLTLPGVLIGTLPYMSPEQVRAEELDERSDIFSLGTVMYEMLGGRNPFANTNGAVTISAILTYDPPPLATYSSNAPAELERIVRKCLEKNKTYRYQKTVDLLNDLEEFKKTLTFEAYDPKPRPRPHNVSVNWIYAAIAVLLAVVVVAVIIHFIVPPQINSINSIAVLPLNNVVGDPNIDYLTEGLTDSLIDSLSQLPDMKVIAHTSVYQYQGQEIDPQIVGRALDVQALLTGRVEQRGDTISINIELIDVRNRSRLWGEQYTRNISDLVTLQKEIGWKVVQRLRVNLSGDDRRLLIKHGTQSAEALQQYEKGRYYWNRRTAVGLTTAIEYFRQAIQIDSNYALAYVGLADCYSLLNAYTGVPKREAFAEAKEAARRALEIDADLAEAHAALATIAFTYDWDWAEAEREYRRAIELNRNSAVAHDGYAVYLTAMGQLEEAIRQSQLAYELDPRSQPINAHVARTYYMARLYDKAIEQCLRTSGVDPNIPLTQSVLGTIYESKGMYEEAIAAFNKANQLSGDEGFSRADLGIAYGLSGRTERATAILQQLLAQSGNGRADPFDIALIYTSIGKQTEAFEWFSRAVDERSFGLVYLKSYPLLDSLRGDERFATLLRRIGLS